MTQGLEYATVAFIAVIWLIFTIVFMVLVLSRLRDVRQELKNLSVHLTALRYPQLPWPQPEPDAVLATIWSEGAPWRMLGDGRWQIGVKGKWYLPDEAPKRAGRR